MAAKKKSVKKKSLVAANRVEVFEGSDNACDKGLLSGAQPFSRVIVLLVRLVLALGVSDLALHISLMLFVVVFGALPRRPLRVGVDVHLDHAVGDRFFDLGFG